MKEFDYPDRLLLAVTWLHIRYERRENFLSDSDVLDAADLFTTDDLGADEMPDYDRLRDDLFAYLTGAES